MRVNRLCMQLLPFDQYVFNTEAHPLPIFDTPIEEAHRAWYLQPPEDPKNPVPLDSESLLEVLSDLNAAWQVGK